MSHALSGDSLARTKAAAFLLRNKAPSISQFSLEMTIEKESKQTEMSHSASAENAFDMISHLEKKLEDWVELINKTRTELSYLKTFVGAMCKQPSSSTPASNTPEKNGKYPMYQDINTSFFKEKLPVEASWILHTIFDIAQDEAWNPKLTSAIGRWKILYFTLYKMKYFKIGDRPRYKAFARAIVKYCYPLVDADKYANNLSKNKIGHSMLDWTQQETSLFYQLKEALTFF